MTMLVPELPYFELSSCPITSCTHHFRQVQPTNELLQSNDQVIFLPSGFLLFYMNLWHCSIENNFPHLELTRVFLRFFSNIHALPYTSYPLIPSLNSEDSWLCIDHIFPFKHQSRFRLLKVVLLNPSRVLCIAFDITYTSFHASGPSF